MDVSGDWVSIRPSPDRVLTAGCAPPLYYPSLQFHLFVPKTSDFSELRPETDTESKG